MANGEVTVEPAGKADTGAVAWTRDLPGVGVLIGAGKGLFLARAANGEVTVEPAGRADTEFVFNTIDLPGVGLLIRDKKGLFLAAETPLARAQVKLRDQKTLDRSPPRPNSDLNIVFTISAHPCAAAAEKLDLRVNVMPPGSRSILKPGLEPQAVHFDSRTATVAVPLRIDKEGELSFQLSSTFGGMQRPVGEVQPLTFTTGGLARLASAVGMVASRRSCHGPSISEFFARRSAWAWQLATDDGLSTWMLRLATLVLSHFLKAQVWILDLYFARHRTKIIKSVPSPFLPLPLTGGYGELEVSDTVLATPLAGKRLLIQGSSGMGKTALFHHVTETHFRNNKTAFAAFIEWGCVVVAFAARDFAGSGEDKDDPVWVVNAVRATLSSAGGMRTLAMPKTAEPWWLTSLREKLVKIGAKVVSHGRSHGKVQVKDGRIRVTSADLQPLFGIRGLSPLA